MAIPGNPAKALFAGAGVGAAITSAPFLFALGPFAIFVFMIAAIVWMTGLLILGAPLWVVLDHFGKTTLRIALVAGAGTMLAAWLGFLAFLALRSGALPTPGLAVYSLWIASFVSCVGAAVGGVIQKVAYGEKAAPRDWTVGLTQ